MRSVLIIVIVSIIARVIIIIMVIIHAIVIAIPEAVRVKIGTPITRIIGVAVARKTMVSIPGIPRPIRTPIRSVTIAYLVLIKSIVTPIRIYPIGVIPIGVDIKAVVTLIVKRGIKSA